MEKLDYSQQFLEVVGHALGLTQLLDCSERTVVCSFQENVAVPTAAELLYSDLVPWNLSKSMKTIGREVLHMPESIRKNVCGSVYKPRPVLGIDHDLSIKNGGKGAFNIKRKLTAWQRRRCPT